MTNRAMIKPGDGPPAPNETPLPPMSAPEDSASPATSQEPIDSPQPNPSAGRAPPDASKPGLATER